ncbi:MAG: signal peptidase I [Microbacteriaceae bacterium]|nr:signal peptidase I [Microbacteriaceae bacterium]
MMPKRSAAKPHGIVYYLGLGLSAGLLAFVVLVGVLAIVVPAATGATAMTVLTGSMSPSYSPGTLIVVKPIEAGDIRIGDAITYQIESGKPAVVTHRVVAITTGSDGSTRFTTQGDANNTPDAAGVIPDQIRGKVWYGIPYLGYVNSAVNGEARGWLIPLIAGGLFLYVGYLAASGIVSKVRNRRNHDGVTSEQAEGGTLARGRRPAARD